jgi:hypothetical protein
MIPSSQGPATVKSRQMIMAATAGSWTTDVRGVLVGLDRSLLVIGCPRLLPPGALRA